MDLWAQGLPQAKQFFIAPSLTRRMDQAGFRAWVTSFLHFMQSQEYRFYIVISLTRRRVYCCGSRLQVPSEAAGLLRLLRLSARKLASRQAAGERRIRLLTVFAARVRFGAPWVHFPLHANMRLKLKLLYRRVWLSTESL